MEKINKRWVLAKRPEGMPEDECWKLEEASIKDLDENQILIKVMYLSIDPYMRGRMNDMKSYTEPVAIGEVMTGESVGQVIQSRSEKFQIGDYVAAHLGWQSFIRCNDDNPALMRIYPDLAPIQSFLGPAGMPGRTAYFGLKEVGKVKESDTVVVSAASGAVGSVVGQMAKLIGCKTVGIAGGKKKCDFVKDVMGLDYAIDYKSKTFRDDLSKACSDGIDIYFENVGGEVSKAVAELLILEREFQFVGLSQPIIPLIQISQKAASCQKLPLMSLGIWIQHLSIGFLLSLNLMKSGKRQHVS